MSENCNHECDSCGSDCPSREKSQKDFIVKTNPMNRIRRVIGVVSGKGGVGKSLVTSILATLFRRKGYETAILDADITGPSIPKIFGLHEQAMGGEEGIFASQTATGISVMSLNLLLENVADPVVWRGPIIAGTVTQFWKDVIWGYVDYMFIDLPPGTGDVPLTVFQSIPIDGVIIVTSPQELVSLIVEKALKMAGMMKVPVLGIAENMSYIICPDCGKKIYPFGESQLERLTEKYGIKYSARIPMDAVIASACDAGMIEQLDVQWLNDLSDGIEKSLPCERED